MPRTASIQKTKRAARKTRAASEISAPVLFRFPDLSADSAAAVDSASGVQAETTATLQATDGAGPQPQPAIQDTTSNETKTATPAIQPKAVSPDTDLPREDAPRVEAAAVAAHRTWWEHWSSGIVLLLLACALLAAGVMAFSDRSGPSDAQLADSGTTELNIPMLSDIDIPDIDASFAQATTPEPAPQETPADEQTLAQSQPQPKLSSDSQTSEAAGALEPAGEKLADTSDSLVPSSFILGGEKLTGPALSIKVDPPAEQSVAKATVGMPIIDGAQPSTHMAPEQQVGLSLPALPVSSTNNQPGESPGMYDGAMVGAPISTQPGQFEVPPLPSSTEPLSTPENANGSLVPNSLATHSVPQDTTPATQAIKPQTQLASGPTQLPVQGASHTTPMPTAGQPVVTASGTMNTASPDWDPEAVVRQWKQYKAKQLTAQPETYLPPPGR